MTPLETHIDAALARHEIVVEDRSRALLVRWAELAMSHGKKTNLIGTTDPARVAEELVADSLQIVPLLAHSPSCVVDVGSGAGVPGLLLTAVYACPATLIEPRQKRTFFLRHAVQQLRLPEVTIVSSRLEDLDQAAWPKTGRRLWVSRAVFAPELWLARCAAYASAGDHCAVWIRGATPPQSHELDALWRRLDQRGYVLEGRGERTVVLYVRR